MGMIFGKINEEMPKYDTVLSEGDFEVRKYGPLVVAEVGGMKNMYTGGDSGDSGVGDAFRQLARYIGVFSKPENVKNGVEEKISMTAPVLMSGQQPGEKIAMTAPVLMGGGEKIAMTAPVLMGGDKSTTMQFVLPSKYTLETAPKPTNPNVSIKEVPGRTMAAVIFSGNMSKTVFDTKEKALMEAVAKAGYTAKGTPIYAGYNPPFTVPWLKRNELMVEVDKA